MMIFHRYQLLLATMILALAACSSSGFTSSEAPATKKNTVSQPAPSIPKTDNQINDTGSTEPDQVDIDQGDEDEPLEDVDMANPVGDAEVKGDVLTINKKIGKIEVATTLDHVTDFVVEQKKIYFTHKHLGFPLITVVKFYDTDGKLIDTKNFSPKFAGGQGANCPAASVAVNYCGQPCDCNSTPVKLTKGHVLKGNLSAKSGRGKIFVNMRDANKTVVVSAYDCGNDCNVPGGGPNLSGQGAYTWTIE